MCKGRLVFLLTFLLGLLTCTAAAWAHPMPHTVVKLTVLENRVQGLAAVPLPELQSAWQAIAPQTPMDKTALSAYFAQHIAVQSPANGMQPWTTHIVSIQEHAQSDDMAGEYTELEVKFDLQPPSGAQHAAIRAFRLRYDAVLHQVVNHKALVSIEQDWRTGIYPERAMQVGVIGTDVVSGNITPLDIKLDAGSGLQGFLGMLRYGAEHILSGADHILFLLMLLVVAPLALVAQSSGDGSRWGLFNGAGFTLKRFLWVSAAFTVGHSLTLVLGVYDVIRIPSQAIEVAIAVSILVSCAHAIRPLFAGREALVAVLFGLVHGLAFANGLRVMQLDTQSKLLSLLGFNLGIELAQWCVMLLCLPLMYLSRYEMYHRIRWVLASMPFVVALYWLWSRLVA